jgi:pyrroline-5-carboxylate reductase
MEAMIDAACHVGFPRSMAQKLVLQTIKGSAIFAEQALKENQELTQLRHNVS